jgi:hypothetical protein
MNLQLLFESVIIAIFVTNSVNVLGGADSAPPPPFLGLRGNYSDNYKVEL